MVEFTPRAAVPAGKDAVIRSVGRRVGFVTDLDGLEESISPVLGFKPPACPSRSLISVPTTHFCLRKSGGTYTKPLCFGDHLQRFASNISRL